MEIEEKVLSMRKLLIACIVVLAILPVRGQSPLEDSLTIYLKAGGAALSDNRIPEAFENFQQALRLDPNNANALKNIGMIHSMKGEFWKALDYFKKAQQQDTADADIYNNLGAAYQATGDTARSLRAYRKAMSLAPDNVAFARNLATMLVYNKRFSEASSVLNLALKKDSADPELQYLMGNVHMAGNHLYDAETSFARAVNLNPAEPRYVYNLAVVKDKLNKKDDAEAAYKRTIELNPRHFDAYQHLGVLYILSKRFPEAVAQFERAVKIRPDDMNARVALGGAYVYNDMPEKAEEVYQFLLKKDSSSAQRLINLITPDKE